MGLANINIQGFDYAPQPAAIASTSITRSGTTATFTTGGVHGFYPGQAVNITGASPDAYNRYGVVITWLSAGSFSYQITVDPGSSATVQGTATPIRRHLECAVDQNGRQLVAHYPANTINTYACGVTFTPVAIAGDIFTFQGFTTKTVRLVRLIISGTATAAAVQAVGIIRRSTLTTYTGGITAVIPAVPLDAQNIASVAAATAVTGGTLLALGTLIGNIDVRQMTFSTPAASSTIAPMIWDFGTIAQPIVLRNTLADLIAISFMSTATPSVPLAATTGTTLSVGLVWTEE
jgi:hypothetical protein